MADESKEKLHIRLHIYDTDMSVNIRPEDEPLYRDAASLITKTMNAYAQRYKGTKSEKELIYMALIEVALRYEMEKARNDTEPYNELLSKLTTELEEALGV